MLAHQPHTTIGDEADHDLFEPGDVELQGVSSKGAKLADKTFGALTKC